MEQAFFSRKYYQPSHTLLGTIGVFRWRLLAAGVCNWGDSPIYLAPGPLLLLSAPALCQIFLPPVRPPPSKPGLWIEMPASLNASIEKAA